MEELCLARNILARDLLPMPNPSVKDRMVNMKWKVNAI